LENLEISHAFVLSIDLIQEHTMAKEVYPINCVEKNGYLHTEEQNYPIAYTKINLKWI
jgi:hypothetical protein